MVLRIVVGLVMTVAAAVIAGRRLWWLGRAGQPAPDRVAAVRSHPGRDVEVQRARCAGLPVEVPGRSAVTPPASRAWSTGGGRARRDRHPGQRWLWPDRAVPKATCAELRERV
jgi:hypothetical protein